MPSAPDPSARPRPLVLLHGLGQSPIAWQDFVSAYGAGRPMTAPWMKGLKPKDPVGFDLGAAAAGVADELELQGVRQADFVGVSVGASVALRLAVERPELVGHLVLGGALVRPSRGALRMQRLAMRLVPEGKLVDAGVSRPRMLAVLDALKGFDGTESLRTITAPVLLVAGSKDKAGIAAAQELSKQLPTARLQVIDGAGPLVNTESARELADLTHAFLDEPTVTQRPTPASTPTTLVRRRGAGRGAARGLGSRLGTTAATSSAASSSRGRRHPLGPVRGARAVVRVPVLGVDEGVVLGTLRSGLAVLPPVGRSSCRGRRRQHGADVVRSLAADRRGPRCSDGFDVTDPAGPRGHARRHRADAGRRPVRVPQPVLLTIFGLGSHSSPGQPAVLDPP